jgi:hypothetical protein
MNKQTKIIWKGLSLLDNSPIVVLAKTGSRNSKTGDMVQTYIIRSDMRPADANRLGADFAICGDCIHRGTPDATKPDGLANNRSCYVEMRGVTAMYKAYRRGSYEDISNHPEAIAKLARGRKVRLGAYGDPAVVDSRLWDNLLKDATGSTGYTHQLNQPKADIRTDLFMISADTMYDGLMAWKNKTRTFRVIHSIKQLAPNEIICPATPEAKNTKPTTCEACRLCEGTTDKTQHAPSIAVIVHGAGKKHFRTNTTL